MCGRVASLRPISFIQQQTGARYVGRGGGGGGSGGRGGDGSGSSGGGGAAGGGGAGGAGSSGSGGSGGAGGSGYGGGSGGGSSSSGSGGGGGGGSGLGPRYNVKPGQRVTVLYQRLSDPNLDKEEASILPHVSKTSRDELVLQDMTWGLVTSLVRDPDGTVRPDWAQHNVRTDNRRLLSKLFHNRRCIVLVDGFYEWDTKTIPDDDPRLRSGKVKRSVYMVQSNYKRNDSKASTGPTQLEPKKRFDPNEVLPESVPYKEAIRDLLHTDDEDAKDIALSSDIVEAPNWDIPESVPSYAYDRPLMWMAGVFSAIPRENDDGVKLTVGILTTDSNSDLGWLHHRMPRLLTPEEARRWLDNRNYTMQDCIDVLRRIPNPEAVPMTTYAVSNVVNGRADTIECVVRLDDVRSKMMAQGIGRFLAPSSPTSPSKKAATTAPAANDGEDNTPAKTLTQQHSMYRPFSQFAQPSQATVQETKTQSETIITLDSEDSLPLSMPTQFAVTQLAPTQLLTQTQAIPETQILTDDSDAREGVPRLSHATSPSNGKTMLITPPGGVPDAFVESNETVAPMNRLATNETRLLDPFAPLMCSEELAASPSKSYRAKKNEPAVPVKKAKDPMASYLIKAPPAKVQASALADSLLGKKSTKLRGSTAAVAAEEAALTEVSLTRKRVQRC